MEELKQSRIWDKRHFKLLDDGVWFRVKTPTEDGETKVKYEELGLEVHYVKKKAASFVFGGLIFLSTIVGRLLLKDADLQDTTDLIFISLFSIFLFGVLYLSWSDSRKPLIGIHGGEKSLVLLRDKPNEETVDKFVEELQNRIKDRIIKLKVRPHDKEVTFEYKKHMLDLLLDQNIIDQKRYHTILSQIAPTKKVSGFNPDFFDLN